MVCCNISNDQMTRFYFVIWSKLCPAAQRVSRIGQLTSVLSLIYLFFIKFIIVTRGYWLKFSFWCSYTDQQGTSWCCSWQEGSNEKIAQVHIWWRKSFGGEPLFWHFVNISWLDKGLEQGLLPFFFHPILVLYWLIKIFLWWLFQFIQPLPCLIFVG